MNAIATPNGAVPARLPADETERLRDLRSYEVLDTLPESVYDDVAFLASYICGTPIALISLIDDERQWFKARVGLDVQETPRDMAFCAHAILEPEAMLEVDDVLQDARFRTNPLVTSEPHIRFYAGVPLVTPAGHALGTLCAIDRTPRTLSDDQRRALSALARAVMTQLELRRTARELRDEVTALRGEAPSAALSPTEERLRALVARMRVLQGETPHEEA